MIYVEEVDEKHYEIYCEEQSEWKDIKTIMYHALEVYDETSLDFILPHTGPKPDGDRYARYERLVYLCERLKGMDESPEKIHIDDFLSITKTIDYLESCPCGTILGVTSERLSYLNYELHKPTEFELRMEELERQHNKQ